MSTWAQLVGSKPAAKREASPKPALVTIDASRDSRSAFDPDFDSSRGAMISMIKRTRISDAIADGSNDENKPPAGDGKPASISSVVVSASRKRIFSESHMDDTSKESQFLFDSELDATGKKGPPKSRQKLKVSGTWKDRSESKPSSTRVNGGKSSNFSRFLGGLKPGAASSKKSSAAVSKAKAKRGVLKALSDAKNRPVSGRRKKQAADSQPKAKAKDTTVTTSNEKKSFAAAASVPMASVPLEDCSETVRSPRSRKSSPLKKASVRRSKSVALAKSRSETTTPLQRGRRLRRMSRISMSAIKPSIKKLSERKLSTPKAAMDARFDKMLVRARSVGASRNHSPVAIKWGPPRKSKDDLLLRTAMEEVANAALQADVALDKKSSVKRANSVPNTSSYSARRPASTGRRRRQRGGFIRRKIVVQRNPNALEKKLAQAACESPSPSQAPSESSVSPCNEQIELPVFESKLSSGSGNGGDSSMFSTDDVSDATMHSTEYMSDALLSEGMRSEERGCFELIEFSGARDTRHGFGDSANEDEIEVELVVAAKGKVEPEQVSIEKKTKDITKTEVVAVEKVETAAATLKVDIKIVAAANNDSDEVEEATIDIDSSLINESDECDDVKEVAGSDHSDATISSIPSLPTTAAPYSVGTPGMTPRGMVETTTTLLHDPSTGAYFVKVPHPTDPSKQMTIPLPMYPLLNSTTTTSTPMSGSGVPPIPSGLTSMISATTAAVSAESCEQMKKNPYLFGGLASTSPSITSLSCFGGFSFPQAQGALDSVGSSSIPVLPYALPVASPPLSNEYLANLANGSVKPGDITSSFLSLPMAVVNASTNSSTTAHSVVDLEPKSYRVAAGGRKLAINTKTAVTKATVPSGFLFGSQCIASSATQQPTDEKPTAAKMKKKSEADTVPTKHIRNGLWTVGRKPADEKTAEQMPDSWASRCFPGEKARILSEKQMEEQLAVKRRMADRRHDAAMDKILPYIAAEKPYGSGYHRPRVRRSATCPSPPRRKSASGRRAAAEWREKATGSNATNYWRKSRANGGEPKTESGGGGKVWHRRSKSSSTGRNAEAGDCKDCALEKELTETQVRRRSVEIGKVKEKIGYRKYRAIVPRETRVRKVDMHTPNRYAKVSKRRFEGGMKVWRSFCHTWDTAPVLVDFDSTFEGKRQRLLDEMAAAKKTETSAVADDAKSEGELLDDSLVSSATGASLPTLPDSVQ